MSRGVVHVKVSVIVERWNIRSRTSFLLTITNKRYGIQLREEDHYVTSGSKNRTTFKVDSFEPRKEAPPFLPIVAFNFTLNRVLRSE